MDISCRWLRDLAPGLTADTQALSEQLAGIGAPVDAESCLGTGIEGVITGRVLEVGPHPNADRLSLCRVDDGTQEYQVVCGAPVIVSGGVYPFAPVGAELPGGIKLRKAKIRGEYSFGMLCSARELGLGDDASGILQLPDDTPVGEPLIRILGLDDVRLDIDVTANRGDLLSHMGVARELAACAGIEVRLPEIPEAVPQPVLFSRDSSKGSIESLTIEVQAPALCSRYLGAIIRGVTVGPSPAWLQNRLRAVGSRSINNVVDATNYVLLELGQPMHAFDLAEIRGGSVIVREAMAGEKILTLDGEKRTLEAGMLAICDSDGPIAIAGVIGGKESEVSATTTDILLECALFDTKSIRRTRKALGMSTDASYRFERGVDPDSMEVSMRRAIELVIATAGGVLDPEALAVGPGTPENPLIGLRLNRVTQILGVSFDAESVRELLDPIGFEVTVGDAPVGDCTVRVPGHRRLDVMREIDVIEEIARRWGYDRFPSSLAPFRPSSVPEDSVLILQDRIRDHLVGRGLLEIQIPAFAPASDGDVEVLNPVSAEEGYLRRSLLPGIIRRVQHNFARGHRDVWLYETGTVFAPGSPLPVEEIRVAAVVTGARERPHWDGAAGDVDLWTVKALLLEIAALCGGSAPEDQSIDTDAQEPGLFVRGEMIGVAVRGVKPLGIAGRIDVARLDLPPWAGKLYGIEISLPLEAEPVPPPKFLAPPQHPGTARDLALIVPVAVSSAEVIEILREESGELFESVEVFDRYLGTGVPEGTSSVAFRIRFRGHGRTLSDDEIEGPMTMIERRLREELDVRVRGA